MGRLAELMQVGSVATGPDTAMNAWGQVPYAQLSVILVQLRFLYLLHHTNHWIAKGDPFYGDHQLFERLYKATLDEIDDVGEKAVGMGSEENVCLNTQVTQLQQAVEAADLGTGVPSPEMLVRKSLEAEIAFIRTVEVMLQSMRDQGLRIDGCENMLQGICDVHERHVYLLKRRCMSTTSGMR